jgi:glutaminyl-tRNA synthetase
VSKRKLRTLVEEGFVSGWDDPRMPTLSGMRRRGIPPQAVRAFIEKVGLTKFNSTSDIALLEYAARDELNRSAERRMAVLDPLEIVITNWPADKVVEVDAVNNPEDESAGTRKIPFSGRLFIEREDFREEANRKYFRLKPGGEVRLRYAYIIKAESVEKDAQGNITRVLCTADLDTLHTNPEDRKVKGVIHWVSADQAVPAEVRLFDRLFSVEKPEADKDRPFTDFVNPDSLQTVTAYVEPALATAEPGAHFQFERIGYFTPDSLDHVPGERPIYNRTVTLRDSWAKQEG